MLSEYTIGGRWVESMTDDEFYTFCVENENIKFEREPDGQIVIMSPTGFNTGRRNAKIIVQLSNWNSKNKLGEVVDSDTGFYLPNGAMRNPDAGWVSNERLASISKSDLEKFPHLVPDFIIELVSKSDYPKNLDTKMKEWIANGCRLGWLIDPFNETVTVYSPGREPEVIKGFDKSVSGGTVLPGFELDLKELKV
jgi:Uma2 family endonuclease